MCEFHGSFNFPPYNSVIKTWKKQTELYIQASLIRKMLKKGGLPTHTKSVSYELRVENLIRELQNTSAC